MRFAPKTVDCPSDAVGNGDTDRLDSRRAWENSQSGYPFYRYSKSYLPTHGVFRKGNGCILYVFAGTTCVRYAEAKRTAGAMQLSAAAAQPACGTPRQSTFNVAASKAHWAQPACGTPRQSPSALTHLFLRRRHNLRAVRRGKVREGHVQRYVGRAQPACGTPRQRSLCSGLWLRPGWAQPACGTPRQSQRSLHNSR